MRSCRTTLVLISGSQKPHSLHLLPQMLCEPKIIDMGRLAAFCKRAASAALGCGTAEAMVLMGCLLRCASSVPGVPSACMVLCSWRCMAKKRAKATLAGSPRILCIVPLLDAAAAVAVHTTDSGSATTAPAQAAAALPQAAVTHGLGGGGTRGRAGVQPGLPGPQRGGGSCLSAVGAAPAGQTLPPARGAGEASCIGCGCGAGMLPGRASCS